MLLLDSEALSAVAQGPAERRDRVRALVAEMRRRERSIGTVAAVLAEVVRGRPSDAAVFAGLRRERIEVHSVDTRVFVPGNSSAPSGPAPSWPSMHSSWRSVTSRGEPWWRPST